MKGLVDLTIYSFTKTNTCTYRNSHTQKYTHTYIYTHMQIYTYMCIYKINGNKTEKFCFKTEHRAFSLEVNYLEGVLISIT